MKRGFLLVGGLVGVVLVVAACGSHGSARPGAPGTGGTDAGTGGAAGNAGNAGAAGAAGAAGSGGTGGTLTTPCAANDLYVAPGGDDANPGTEAKPFKTMEAARDAIRTMKAGAGLPAGGIEVCLRGGLYPRDKTFDLTDQDSGTLSQPIVWRAYQGETPRIVGSIELSGSDFKKVDSSSAVWSRLDSSAQGHVLALDLSKYTTDYGSLDTRRSDKGGNNSAAELAFNDSMMQLARYPDYVKASDVPAYPKTIDVSGSGLNPDVSGTYSQAGTYNGKPYYKLSGQNWFIYFRPQNAVYYLADLKALGGAGTYAWWSGGGSYPTGSYHPDSGSPSGMPYAESTDNIGFVRIASTPDSTHFVYSGTRPSRWGAAKDIYMLGYWKYLWDARNVAVTNIDTGTKTITVTSNPYGINAHEPYFAYNLLEEITVPGEYYIDRSTGTLYFWPPGDSTSGELMLSMLQDDLVHLNGAKYVTLRGLTLELGRGELVRIEGGSDDVLDRCTLGNNGNDAVRISGLRNGLSHCTLHDMGGDGVVLSGGDRKSLTPGNDFVKNCDISHFGRIFWTYHPAVTITDPSTGNHEASDGNVVAHNHIHDAPHAGILFNGNEHHIEYNVIDHVCEWASDAGAIYSGRAWDYRGTEIRYNFIHDIQSPLGPAVHGIYLDDCLSGEHVFGNVLYKAGPSSALMHGGGRDDIFENNIIVKSGSALHTDMRCTTAIKHDGSSSDLLKKAEDMNYTEDPWKTAYPALAAIPDNWSQIAGSHWLYPEGDVFSRNIGWKNDLWTVESSGNPLSFFAEQKDNIEDQDPQFVDEANLDLTLKSSSPALSIPGFQPIPFSQIGIQK
jgi:hypothetical protein